MTDAVQATPAPRPEPSGSAFEVAVDPTKVLVPSRCACCLEPAGYSRKLRGSGGELLIPYCEDCLEHASWRGTRVLAAGTASALLGLVTAAALPLMLPYLPLLAYMLIVASAAAVPAAGVFVFRPSIKPGHFAAENAAWWRGEQLACANPRWARELADRHGLAVTPSNRREPRISAWTLSGVLLGIVLAPFWHLHLHPIVRILNLTDASLHILSDGRHVATLTPTSSESASAGEVVRIPAGARRLTARYVAGDVIFDSIVELRASAEHLFAPGPHDQCFWLELSNYGRARAKAPAAQPLSPDAKFWILPMDVDSWFAPNPAAAMDLRSSGGVLTALRQAPCRLAPSSAIGNSH